MFWGNTELRRQLPSLIDPYDTELIDKANYTLRVGPEVYVSPTGTRDDPRNKTKKKLEARDDFVIPAGQFAFLITEEKVTVPSDAIAFISMRASYKFQGLVNVSGFHVDPGFSGRLIFSVFNAGPAEVRLERLEKCFHIWFADLRDHESTKNRPGYEGIPAELINRIKGGVQSFAGLDSKIDDTDRKLSERLTTIEREQAVVKWAAALIVGGLIALGVRSCAAEKSLSQNFHQLQQTQQHRGDSVEAQP